MSEIKGCTAWSVNRGNRWATIHAHNGFSQCLPHAALVVDFTPLPQRYHLPAFLCCEISSIVRLCDGECRPKNVADFMHVCSKGICSRSAQAHHHLSCPGLLSGGFESACRQTGQVPRLL